LRAMLRILIADDHAIVRRGLKEIVSEEPDMEVGGEARDGYEVIALIESQTWDVVVLDISMPGANGLDLLKEIKRRKPMLTVLVLSAHPEEQYGLRALKSGAAGYLTKRSAPEELVTAIRKVGSGQMSITASLAERLVVTLEPATKATLHETLSDRELQVLCLIARGKSLTEIGEELCLSAKTIRTHRTRLLAKMRMKSNAELIRYAINEGWLVD